MVNGRRGSGEGSIYPRIDGRWCAQTMLSDKRRYIYPKSRREVQRKLRELQSNTDKGILPPSERPTVQQYLHRVRRRSVGLLRSPLPEQGLKDEHPLLPPLVPGNAPGRRWVLPTFEEPAPLQSGAPLSRHPGRDPEGLAGPW